MTDTGHLYVTWERYHRLIELLALQIHDSKWEFDSIIAIARGGGNPDRPWGGFT